MYATACWRIDAVSCLPPILLHHSFPVSLQDIRNLSKIARTRCLLAHSASIWGAALLPDVSGAVDNGCAVVTCAGGWLVEAARPRLQKLTTSTSTVAPIKTFHYVHQQVAHSPALARLPPQVMALCASGRWGIRREAPGRRRPSWQKVLGNHLRRSTMRLMRARCGACCSQTSLRQPGQHRWGRGITMNHHEYHHQLQHRIHQIMHSGWGMMCTSHRVLFTVVAKSGSTLLVCISAG